MKKALLKLSARVSNLAWSRKSSSSFEWLEMTRLKYTNSIRAAEPYFKVLSDEKRQIEAAISKANVHGKMLERYSYVKQIESELSELKSAENDLGELARSEESDAEMKKLFGDELERLRVLAEDKRRRLVDLVLPEDSEDKESALLELNAGVGGLESRIFCGELYEMYRAYCEVRV